MDTSKLTKPIIIEAENTRVLFFQAKELQWMKAGDVRQPEHQPKDGEVKKREQLKPKEVPCSPPHTEKQQSVAAPSPPLPQKTQQGRPMQAQQRDEAEIASRNNTERNTAIGSITKDSVTYKKYSIEEIEKATDYFSESLKIGEGGYGPVFKATLDHTQVAIKVLRPDVSQGLSQFRQEVGPL